MTAWKILCLAFFGIYFHGVAMFMGELANYAFHLLHWVFKGTQWGANASTVGTFFMAIYKAIFPEKSLRTLLVNRFGWALRFINKIFSIFVGKKPSKK